MTTPNPLLLSIDQIAAVLQVGRRTAYELRKRPGFPMPITLGGRIVRYRATDVAQFVERLAADAAPPPEPERLNRGRAAYLALPAAERKQRRSATAPAATR